MGQGKGSSKRINVAVLMGGSSSERQVSLKTGSQIANALSTERYEVRAVDTQDLKQIMSGTRSDTRTQEIESQAPGAKDSGNALQPGLELAAPGDSETLSNSESWRPDIVFIALHGKGGEDGSIQGMLEFMGIPYTGSGVLASAIAIDKSMTKRLFTSAGIQVIDGVVINREQFHSANFAPCALEWLGLPLFVKPNREGSTFGCSLVDTLSGLSDAIRSALSYDDSVLVEKYISGVEITAGVIEGHDGMLRALPLVEIVPKAAYYDYESKYADGGSEHIIPARISPEITREAQELALKCHRTLGCSGVSRTDMIVADSRLYVLEVNTIPGMTPTSLLPQAAESDGIEFRELLTLIVEAGIRARPSQG